ncbi:Uncharacterised protein g1763 [Pycnogonum litorale]
MMPVTLIAAAEYSYLISILTIIISFFVMLLFIIRMERRNIDLFNGSSVTYVQRPLQSPKRMVPIHNPFIVSMENPKKSSLIQGVTLRISSQVDCNINCFWGVSVADLHHSLRGPETGLMERNLISVSCLHSQTESFEKSDVDRLYYLKSPETVTDLAIGPMPRRRYPLVVIMSPKDCLNDTSSFDVAAMVSILHLKDAICTMESCLLAQYLKLKDGRVTSLKKLFIEGDSSSTNETNEGVLQNSYVPPDCIICQTRPISRALLPCRHTCICANCFSRLQDRCPLCRSPITSFFCIAQEHETDPDAEQSDDAAANPQTWFERMGRFNNNLNEWLGIT